MLSKVNREVEVTELEDTTKTLIILDPLTIDGASQYYLTMLSELKPSSSITKTGLSSYRFVDDIAKEYYGDSSYWVILCYYNNIINPLNFKEEISYNKTFDIPDKADIDSIINSINQ